MTEAYLIEDGEITEPLRERQPDRQRPEVLADDRHAVGNDFAMGSPGTCGKDGQGVPVGDGQPDAAGAGAHDRRDRGMSAGRGRRRAARPRRQGRRRVARPGEQVEAYVAGAARPRRPRRRTGGEVESLRQAQSERRRRAGASSTAAPGFAYAGTPRRGASSPRCWPRRATTPRSAPPDERAGLAEPDGVEPHPAADLWRRRAWPSFPTERKVELALELERATLGRDPHVRRAHAPPTADALGRGGGRHHAPASGPRAGASCYVTVGRRSPTTAARPRAPVRALGRPRPARAARRRRGRPPRRLDRATRLLGADQAGHASGVTRRARAVRHGASSSASIVGDAQRRGGRSRAQRRSATGSASRWPRRCVTFVDDPTNPRSLGADEFDGEGLGPPPQRAGARRRAPGVPAQHLHRPPGRHALHRLPPPARLLPPRPA